MNRTNNKNYAQAAAQQKNNKQASHTNNPSHQNQQHHHQQVSQQNQASGPPTSSNYSSSANGKSINNSQTKPQTPHNSTMGNGNTGRSASIKQQKNSVTLPTNGHSWETAPTSLVFGSIKNTSNAQISSLPSSTSQTLTSGGGLPTTLPTKGVPTFGSLPTNTTTTPTTQATQATQATPTTVGTSGPGVNNINNNNNNNNSNGTSKSISARANEIPRTHSAPPLFQDSNNRNQSAAVPPHQQSSASVNNNNPPLNHRKDSVSSTVSSNDGQPQFHPHHSPHHPPNHTNQHGHPAFRHPQHHNTHKPIQQMYRPRDKQHPSPHLNPAQQPVPTQQSAMPIGPPPHMFQMYPNHRGVYYMDYTTGYPVAPHNMYSIPPFVPQRPPPMSQPIPPVNNVSFQKQPTSKAIQIIDPNRNAPIQINTNNIQRQQQNYKREETPSTVPDKKTKESDKEVRPSSDDKGVSKAVPIVDPAEKIKEREEREKKEREEQERIAKEKEERERKEREERLELERIAKEKEEQERKEREEREEQERLAKEKEERERKEREEREEQERIAKEKEELERKEREEREKKEREELERLAKEKEERERKERERLELERIAKEKEERERKEREEREEQERLVKEKEERERKEREEREELERIAKEKEEQERKEREERERLELERIAKEKEERERKEKEEREERERLEAVERIEKERKEAEEKALKEQEEKALLKEADIEKKEEEEPKSKATPEEEAEKKKKAETLDKKDDKKEEKKRPGPLDLSRTTSAPAIPSAPLSALGSARMLDDLSSIQYPQGIKSPNPELNSNAEPGKFKYDRTFLMQFMTVCKEKPENLPALEAIGMEESKDDKKRTNTRSNSGPRTSSLHKGSPNQSQFSQMGEFKFTPLKTSEERFAASMRNGMPASGIFGRTALGRTGSGSTLLPPTAAMTPPSPGRTPSGRNRDNRRTGKGSHQMQGSNMGQEHVAPLERTENRWVPQILNSSTPLPKSEESIPFESVQRKVKALLNKLTLEKFDSISDQIIDFANKSRDERDGRILREVIRLIFEKSCDESNFCAMYAQLCRKMMERVDPEIVDENVKNTEGKFVQGGTLFRKYLLNRCQEEFEKGWKVNVPVPSNEKGEPDLMSDEYYVAARAKRQGLGLIRFIGELFKLNMLTERIMHECIKKLLIFQGSPEEEEMESLCKLMNTVGEQLDHVKPNPHEQMKSTQLDHAKAKKYMESYFDRMEEISKLPNLSSRIKFMLMDVMDLRSNAWKPRRDINAPKTIAEIHEDAAKQKEEAEYLRRTTSSGGRGMPKMSEQMSRSGSSRQHRSDKGMTQSPDGWSTVGSSSQRNKEKVGDLTKFGSVNRSKIVSLAPGGILGGLSGGAKGWSKGNENKDPNDKPGLNRANSTTNIYSVLNSESSEGRKSSESNSSDTQKPSPPTERKKLILAPRTKSFTSEEPVKLVSKSTSGSASSSQTTVELDSKKICKSIVNMMEEYFSILDSQEVITCLKEDTPVEYHPKAIETFANKVIEKKQKDVDDVMKLFKEIVSSSTCDNDAFKDGFKATLEFLMEIGADAPMAYSYTGQLLFSTELDFRDIIELLKPLDDYMAIDKIVKGYAKALKNDVDEQKYVQKINEFDLTSLFPKKNKDDINKYIEDLGGSSKK
ncbi:unnamed protein product [Rhizophagus irregularis]|nr:unnamed protein product [Rhizophagus irregularis]CAB5188099.1 unnamed protein product [Rhizophagus irregularis]